MTASDNTRFDYHMANLHTLLKAAMLVELTTIPAYLHAAFSIEDLGAEHVNHAPREAIRSVVVEEMLHLTLIANILNATGGRPALDQSAWIPQYPCSLFPKALAACTLRDPTTGEDRPIVVSEGINVHLRPFSQEQVKLFESIEAQHSASCGAVDGKIDSIGRLYAGLKSELCQMVDLYGREAVFCGDPARQVGPEYYYAAGGRLTAIDPSRHTEDPLTQAQTALDLIANEGEGLEHGHSVFDGIARPDETGADIAHVFRFREILKQTRYRDGDCWNEDPTGDAMAVDWKSVWPLADDPDPDDPALTCETANAMREFDRRYSVVLRTINGGLLGEPELLKTAVVGMFSLKYRGMALMRTPRGDGRNAAPAWRWLDKGE
ncbi:MAG: ferritin-like protein [Defluviicoccus sp.]